MMWAILVILVLMLSQPGVEVSRGTSISPDAGFVVSNIDPTFRSAVANEIYDPNFIPGFQAGLQNVSVSWTASNGRGILGYRVGPWARAERGIPHLAVGPQCCNFKEIPRTQQFRKVEWGDYYYVRAGFTSPGVNVENFTTNFSSPADVGLRTDWDWHVRFSLDWSQPILLSEENSWAALGITATQYVPQAPGKLVYSVVNLWMDENSSSSLHQSGDRSIPSASVGTNVVEYHPVQLSGSGNQTVEIDLSPYLRDTLDVLGYSQGLEAPVISYVYLNVEGYNFRWNTTLYSFYVMSDTGTAESNVLFGQQLPFMVVLIVAVAVTILAAYAAESGNLVSKGKSL